jgi:DNA repair protein RadC
MARKSSLADKLNYGLPKMRLCLVNETLGAQPRITIQSPQDAAKLLSPLKHAPEEHFVSLHLNAKNEVKGIHEVSHGTLSSSLVHPREVFKAALIANSYAILVCHNHPSGSSLAPSKEDLDTTKQLLKAGLLIGVAVVDHLIVSPNDDTDDVYSLRENHPNLWKQEKCCCA